MEIWELVARESIRDLVSRYNANADAGRFDMVLALFAEDATFELVEDGVTEWYEGREGIRQLLESFQDKWAASAQRRNEAPYVRHFVATHQIDIEDEHSATGRSYAVVVKAHGLDHWGRYLDAYIEHDGRWLISRRRAITDGRISATELQ